MLTVVHDLGGNPEPLKLYSTLRTLISSLEASDNAFAMEVSQIYKQTKQTNIKIFAMTSVYLPPSIFWRLSCPIGHKKKQKKKKKRKKKRGENKNANLAIASFTAAGSTKPICRNFMTAMAATGEDNVPFYSLPLLVAVFDVALQAFGLGLQETKTGLIHFIVKQG